MKVNWVIEINTQINKISGKCVEWNRHHVNAWQEMVEWSFYISSFSLMKEEGKAQVNTLGVVKPEVKVVNQRDWNSRRKKEEGSKDLRHATILVWVSIISHGGHLNHYHSILFPFIPVDFQTFSMLQPKQFF